MRYNKMNGVTTAFWSVTINNPDERDMAIMERGYPDYCRKVVWTLEEGDKGTPHIQAFVKLQRQQRMSFLRKLFPGGHFKALTSDEYILNTESYAQKNDETTRSAHVQQFNDPMKTIESVVKQVILEMRKDLRFEIYDNSLLLPYRKIAEKRMVERDYKYAKIFVSSTYKTMWKEFGPAMYSCVVGEEDREPHTHTHTHSDRKKSVAENIPNDGTDGQEGEGDDRSQDGSREGSEDDEGDEEYSGSEDEGYDSGGSSSDCSEDARSED